MRRSPNRKVGSRSIGMTGRIDRLCASPGAALLGRKFSGY
jgi:hypothetical protein